MPQKMLQMIHSSYKNQLIDLHYKSARLVL